MIWQIQTIPLSVWSSPSTSKGCKECVAKLTREKRNGIVITDKPKQIDWEQRRYEIAKAAMVGELASPVVEGIDPNPSITDVAKWSVMLADALINELKKHDNE